MKRIREHGHATLAASALLFAVLAGCATTSVDPIGGESHFVACTSDRDCASGGGACVHGVCQSKAALNQTTGDADTTSGGGNAGSLTGSDSGPVVLASVNVCTGACCPTDASCYVSGNPGPGAECLARRENTGQSRLQFRQTWSHSVAPAGFAIPILYQTLNAYAQLPDSRCEGPDGDGAYTQAFDFDLDRGVARVGYTSSPMSDASARADGLCMGEISAPGWKDEGVGSDATIKDFALPASRMSPSTDYPPGLPAPMPQPWIVKPTNSLRLVTDFDPRRDRVSLLGKLAKAGEYGSQGYTGVFFLDLTAGRVHTFSPLAYRVIDGPIANGVQIVPVREVEESWRLNDPARPDCVGRYQANPNEACVDDPDPSNARWKGLHDTTPGEGDAIENGYFLITELEQVYSPVLGETFCHLVPTAAVLSTEGWGTPTDSSCRDSPNWNPSDPVNGLPQGDWCAATNSAATPSCHDAYRSVTYQALQAFPVRDGTCPIQ